MEGWLNGFGNVDSLATAIGTFFLPIDTHGVRKWSEFLVGGRSAFFPNASPMASPEVFFSALATRVFRRYITKTLVADVWSLESEETQSRYS